jgi:asparagine synthase (glutamine-hydrolysing)
MAFSIEARVPFLDYRLVEYVFSMPSDQKLRNGMTKVVLRNAMREILPETVRTRVDKMGFVTPENIWFRTILKDRINEIIRSTRFRDIGYFNVPEVEKMFKSHCRGERDIGFTIWRWINLLLWWEMFINRSNRGLTP